MPAEVSGHFHVCENARPGRAFLFVGGALRRNDLSEKHRRATPTQTHTGEGLRSPNPLWCQYGYAFAVALAASTAFMTPISSPANTLVATSGNYRFGDFLRVGAPLSAIVMLVSVVLVAWLLPLR